MNFKRSNNESSICRAILGPTNTGKTYYALERMISYKNGVIGVPLRLLAREIYDRLVLLKGTENVVLSTGEEKIRGKFLRKPQQSQGKSKENHRKIPFYFSH